jgi:hypothetical protein
MTRHVGPTCQWWKEWKESSNRDKSRAFWSFHVEIPAGTSELARHVGQSGKIVSNVQRIWQICSYICKVGISWGATGKDGKKLNSLGIVILDMYVDEIYLMQESLIVEK